MSAVPVEFVTADGVTLRGECRRGDRDWVVLVHDLGSDLDCWDLFPELWDWPLSVLAFDLRGHGGSDGNTSLRSVQCDVVAATGFARSHGRGFVCVVAAGKGAVNALNVPPDDLADAYVLVSPDPNDLGTDLASLRAPQAAKMVIVGSLDEGSDLTARALSSASIGPCTVVSFPTNDQGTDLLKGKWGGHAFERMNRFVQEQRYLASDEMRRY